MGHFGFENTKNGLFWSFFSDHLIISNPKMAHLFYLFRMGHFAVYMHIHISKCMQGHVINICHSCFGPFWRVALMGHFGGSFGWVILVGHFDSPSWWTILVFCILKKS